jgi:hypothetical protein
MKSLSGVMLGLSLSMGTILTQIQPIARVLLPEPFNAKWTEPLT